MRCTPHNPRRFLRTVRESMEKRASAFARQPRLASSQAQRPDKREKNNLPCALMSITAASVSRRERPAVACNCRLLGEELGGAVSSCGIVVSFLPCFVLVLQGRDTGVHRSLTKCTRLNRRYIV